MSMLSGRGNRNVDELGVPWRFARRTTYDSETNPEGMISFATAEQLLMGKELEELANKIHIPAEAFTYKYSTAGGERFPKALARFLNEWFGPWEEVEAEDVKITAAATALHECLGFALADPGEGVLMSRPYYGRFELDFGNKAGVKVIAADTQAEDCFQVGVVEKYEEALKKAEGEGVRIRVLLVVNPHNPLGRCYPKETLISLMRFCQTHSLHFISDEVYALSVFDSGEPSVHPFTSVLAINPTDIIDRNLVHVTYAMSKDFGSAGLKLGALITKNHDLKRALLANVRFHGSSGPSLTIASAMLEDHEWCRNFIILSRQRLADVYKYVTSRLGQMGIKYLAGSNAGFFIWIDLSPWFPPESEGLADREREQMLAQKFVDRGVFLQPGEEHALKCGWFRVVFSMERRVVEEGLRRINKVLKNIGKWD